MKASFVLSYIDTHPLMMLLVCVLVKLLWFLQLLLFGLSLEQIDEACLALEAGSNTVEAACAEASNPDIHHLRR
jgi:hypothetical protein